MPKIFSAVEAVELGIEKEKKRRDFYALVASRFSEKEMKDLFSRLADWEELHVKKFTDIRDEIAEAQSVESYPGELTGYMQSLVDDLLYNKVSADSFSQIVASPIIAVDYAIGFEKDAILFFLEILSFMTLPQRKLIQKLIEEEKQHIIYLADLRRKLK
jgi:rubrerythrin